MARLAVGDSVGALDEREWDAAAPGKGTDPFTTHRFLVALETSGSVGGRSGWLPHPVTLFEGARLDAALPLYVKLHSQGEYVFDHGWAEAFERAGGRYYPKLQVAVPFTPVTGARFLGPPPRRRALTDAAIALAEENSLSSLHVTFCSAEEAADLAGYRGFLHRTGIQFHWHNRGYRDFDDFLGVLSSRKRKAIRKEREAARAGGLAIHALTGDAIAPAHWDAFWSFYQDTGARKWGHPYLTRAAFAAFHASMRDDILLVMAFDGARAVAGALNFIGRDALFGRYWGCIEDHPFLHFELCYHQAIEWAIAHGLSRVEAGAQGEHKLARGYLPVTTHSLHWIADAGLRRAVARYLAAERPVVEDEITRLRAAGPYRREGG